MSQRAGSPHGGRVEPVAARLAVAGFLAADEEAALLVERAGGDDALLEALVSRRLTGEPLAWITGSTVFCGVRVQIDPGVYVPRWHTEVIARRAIECLPHGGVLVDVCTGSGAIAAAVGAHRADATVVGCDIDERAVVCARRNGVRVYRGDLLTPLPRRLHRRADVITAVVPYVPTPDLPFLQRDTFVFESALAYDGGPDGIRELRRTVRQAVRFLRRQGTLLLELGGGEAGLIRADLERHGYAFTDVIRDADGDVRGIEATLFAAR